MVGIIFECLCGDTEYGDEVYVTGNVKELGEWKILPHLILTTEPHTYPSWYSRRIDIREGTYTEFKFIIKKKSGGHVIWENIPENRKMKISCSCKYGSSFGSQKYHIVPIGEEMGGIYDGCSSSSSSSSSRILSKRGGAGGASFARKRTSESLAGNVHNAWMGDEQRMNRSRSRLWRMSSLLFQTSNLSENGRMIVEGDASAGSWRKKLEVLQKLIAPLDVENKNTPHLNVENNEKVVDALVNASIYLQLIYRGDVTCVEDGGHFRPNAHANLAKQIFAKLETLLVNVHRRDDIYADEIRLISRKIHPNLPSFSDEFTSAQPLTRIRDIAHRNDIPQELKQEIKHTIQNKLHRCAGPEDLVNTEKMLHRFLNEPHKYPPAFIQEFKTFHKELQQFFNASNLQERLHKLKETSDNRTVDLMNRFLDAKSRSDDMHASVSTLLVSLAICSELRGALIRQIHELGIINQHHIPLMQQRRLAEINLEEVVFVLLSRLETLSDANPKKLADAIEALSNGVRNVQLSGLRREECGLIAKELNSYIRREFSDRNELLLLKAALDRTRRLTEIYTDIILSTVPPNVLALGKALNVPKHSIQVFAEADIRANIIFQVSKISTQLQRRVRRMLGDRGVDAIVTGHAIGVLKIVEKLDMLNMQPHETHTHKQEKQTNDKEEDSTNKNESEEEKKNNDPVVLLVLKASGDEELTAVKSHNIVAIILAHDLPHLSHLGVRARQEDVVFVAVEEKEMVEDLRRMEGKYVHVEAQSTFVDFQPSNKDNLLTFLATQKSLVRKGSELNDGGEEFDGSVLSTQCDAVGGVDISNAGKVVRMQNFTVDTVGAKAYNCYILHTLAETSKTQNNGACFKAPKSAAYGFGTLEFLVSQQNRFDELRKLFDQIEAESVESEKMEGICESVQRLICSLDVPDGLISPLKDIFDVNARLALRSSANVEDLAGMSAAGLYESILNVSLSDMEGLKVALLGVLASLFTHRAVLTRKLAGFSQDEAYMAVLVQEMIDPSYSFILHTVNPLDRKLKKDELYAEMAAGLGDTLASADVRGSPYRFICNKINGEFRVLSYSSYSTMLVPVLPRSRSFSSMRHDEGDDSRSHSTAPPASSSSSSSTLHPPPPPSIFSSSSSLMGESNKFVRRVNVDYLQNSLSTNFNYFKITAQKLTAVGALIEKHLQCPQDIEGVLVDDEIYVVQTRPQP